jgi:hypothetical protein
MIRLFWLTVLIVALSEKPAYSQDGSKILVGRVVDAITNDLAVRHLQCRTTDKKDLKSNLSRFEITNLEQRDSLRSE